MQTYRQLRNAVLGPASEKYFSGAENGTVGRLVRNNW